MFSATITFIGTTDGVNDSCWSVYVVQQTSPKYPSTTIMARCDTCAHALAEVGQLHMTYLRNVAKGL